MAPRPKQRAVSAQPSLVDRILLLPPELRCMVYHRVVGSASVRDTHPGRAGPQYIRQYTKHSKSSTRSPAILKIDKALRCDVLTLNSPYDTIILPRDLVYRHGAALEGLFYESVQVTSLDIITSMRQIQIR